MTSSSFLSLVSLSVLLNIELYTCSYVVFHKRSDVPIESASSVFCFAGTTGSWHVTVPQVTLHCPKPSPPLLADPRSWTWTAVVACLHTSSCDPHCGHAPPPTADTPPLAPILHMVRADRTLRYSLLHELHDDESRVIAAPTCHTLY